MKGALPIWGWVIIGMALLVSCGFDFWNMVHGGSIDMRNRVTGARLMAHGIDAYTYKWTYGEPDVYLDVYNNPNLPVSKTTVTPTLLVLHLPLTAVAYRPAQFIWFFASWAMLLGTAWLWLRRCTAAWQSWALALFVTGFTYTAMWRLHADRGQAYILFTFFFALWLVTTLEKKWSNSFAAGCLAGFLMTLRPPFLMLMPFLALHRRGQLWGAGAGLVLGIVAPLFIHPQAWNEYFSAMQTNSHLYRDNINPKSGPHRFLQYTEEMSTDVMGAFSPIPYADSSIYKLLRSGGLDRNPVTNEAIPAWPALLLLTLPFAYWLWLTRGMAAERLLAGLAGWLFVADFLLPAYRNTYNDVLILDVVALGVIAAARIPWALWPCVAALPMGWWIYTGPTDSVALVDTPSILLAVGALGFIFLPVLLPERRAKATA